MKLLSTAGVRRQLTNQVLRDIFGHWNTVEPGTSATRGQLTLTHLYRTEPALYAKLVAALLPKDILIESAIGDMDDDQIDDVIARIKERLIDVRAAEARPVGRITPRQIGSSVAEPGGGEGAAS
jgi:hypothetical protein